VAVAGALLEAGACPNEPFATPGDDGELIQRFPLDLALLAAKSGLVALLLDAKACVDKVRQSDGAETRTFGTYVRAAFAAKNYLRCAPTREIAMELRVCLGLIEQVEEAEEDAAAAAAAEAAEAAGLAAAERAATELLLEEERRAAQNSRRSAKVNGGEQRAAAARAAMVVKAAAAKAAKASEEKRLEEEMAAREQADVLQKKADEVRNPVSGVEHHRLQEGSWSVVSRRSRAVHPRGPQPPRAQLPAGPRPMPGPCPRQASRPLRPLPTTAPKTCADLLRLHDLAPLKKQVSYYVWFYQLALVELHSQLSEQREATIKQVNELWKEHAAEMANADASLTEDRRAVRRCAAAGLLRVEIPRDGNCAYLCAARWQLAVAQGAAYPGAEEESRAESGGRLHGQEGEVASGAAIMRTTAAARLRALLAAQMPAVLSEVDSEINDLTKTVPPRRTATGELLCTLLRSDPLRCAESDVEAAAVAAREHYVATMETPSIFAERLQIKLLSDVLRAPIHVHYSTSSECEVFQPNELCDDGGDETTRSARPPMQLLLHLTAKVQEWLLKLPTHRPTASGAPHTPCVHTPALCAIAHACPVVSPAALRLAAAGEVGIAQSPRAIEHDTDR
jgi:hypothetical protein